MSFNHYLIVEVASHRVENSDTIVLIRFCLITLPSQNKATGNKIIEKIAKLIGR